MSERKLRSIVRYFALDLTARQCAALTGVSLRSVNSIYLRGRARMSEFCARHSPLCGELEADASYFGGAFGASQAAELLERLSGPLKRGDCVYTEIVPDATKATLQAVIRGKADIDSIIYTDDWRGYHGLVDISFDKLFRGNHSQNKFARGKRHINRIESFWNFAKARLVQLKGIPKHTFALHLRECEFRFNHRKQNLYQSLLPLLQNNPL